MARFRHSESLLAVIVLVLLTAPASAHPPVAESIRGLSHRITHEPGDATLYLRRGELYRSERQWEAALEDFRRAAEIAPSLATADLSVARLHLDRGTPRLAIPFLDRFVAGEPHDPRGWDLRGQAFAALGRHVEAQRDLAAAIDRSLASAGRPRPALFLAWAEAAERAGLPAETLLAGLERGLASLGAPVTLELAALRIETDGGRFDAALRRLDRLQGDAQRPETWLVRRASVLESAGRFDEARSALRAALQAIERLPAGRRDVPAMARLASDARDALARLAGEATNTQVGGK